jgi:hypothetical protein
MNYLMIFVMALSAFLLGGLWYSKLLFGKAWCQDAGINMDEKQGHPAKVFGISFVFALIAAFAFAYLFAVHTSVADAVMNGLFVGALFAGTSFGINYQFANRSTRMWFIDAGYHTAQFALYGLIAGLWPM